MISEKKLRKFILRNQIRPEQLAADSGLSFATIRNVLSGRHKPYPHTLRLIAEAAGYEEETEERE